MKRERKKKEPLLSFFFPLLTYPKKTPHSLISLPRTREREPKVLLSLAPLRTFFASDLPNECVM